MLSAVDDHATDELATLAVSHSAEVAEVSLVDAHRELDLDAEYAAVRGLQNAVDLSAVAVTEMKHLHIGLGERALLEEFADVAVIQGLGSLFGG